LDIVLYLFVFSHVAKKALLLSHGGDPRVGRPHRLAPQLIRGPFVAAHLAWCKTQEQLTAVNLSRCQLAAVPQALSQLRATLRRLDLSCNLLEVVPRQIQELTEVCCFFAFDVGVCGFCLRLFLTRHS
jgi:hypothetical protein